MEKIICHSFFPMQASKKFLKNATILSIGANLGNPLATFRALFNKMNKNKNLTIHSTSPIYINPPFGFVNQSDFYNATMIISTNFCLLELYRFVFYMERIFGRARKRAFKNAPRILDIDILFFNDLYFRSAKLNIPHLHWEARASVIVPLYFQAYYKGF